MKTNITQGWSTLQEGTEHYLYRSVSSMSLARLESLVQRLQECQNPCIAIPEIVRLANGEVYLKEPRGIRSVEDFLSTYPSTRAKLFVVQQLLKLLENLHTFVGTAHGDLHIGCLSIGVDDKLILGGIAPVDVDASDDVEALKPLLSKLFTQPIEAEILRILNTRSLKRMRRVLKSLLAEDAWDDIQSDWSNAIQQTNIEDSSEELHLEEISHPSAMGEIDEDPFDFDELDQTLDLGNPLDDLDGMPEPNNVHLQTEEQTLEALFDEFDNLDDLDDFGPPDDEVDLDLSQSPEPAVISAAIEQPPVEDQDPVSEDWSDVDLDSWLDDVPEPASLQTTLEQPNPSDVQIPTVVEAEGDTISSNSDTLTPDMFDEGSVDDWFGNAEETIPLNDKIILETKTQTTADLEEISDFDDEDNADDETILFSRSAVQSLESSVLDTERQTTETAENIVSTVDSATTDHTDSTSDLDWFDNTETADFALADFELDALTAEANDQRVDDIPEFSIDEFDVEDISPNESDIKAATDINDNSSPDYPIDEDSTDIYSRHSVLGTPHGELHPYESDSIEQEMESEDMEDWFADTMQHSVEPSESSVESPLQGKHEVDEPSIPKWMMVASAAVVAGGAWSATQTRQMDTPSVHIDESQTKELEKINTFVPTVKTAAVETTKSVVEEQTPEKEPATLATNTIDNATDSSTPRVQRPVRKNSTRKSKVRTKNSTPFTKTDKTVAAAKSTTKTTAKTLPPPKKARKIPVKKTTVTAKPEVNVQAPVQVKNSTPESKAAPTNTKPTSDSIAASLTQMVTGSDGQSTTAEQLEATPSPPEKTVEVTEVPDKKSTDTTESSTVSTANVPEPVPAEASTSESTPVTETEESEPNLTDDNKAVEIDDTLSESVVSEVNATERVVEETLNAGSGTPRVATTEMAEWSASSVSGSLSTDTVEVLQQIPATDRMFTRANAIVLTHAQQSNNPALIENSLNNLLSVDANTHKPIYLLAMAQYQFNQQNLDGAREYLMQAEMNWANVERSQLSILRAQRDNIVAHLSYIDFLENGSEDSRLQSLTQFRKVQREARRARLQSLFEQAEAKMQKLQRQKR